MQKEKNTKIKGEEEEKTRGDTKKINYTMKNGRSKKPLEQKSRGERKNVDCDCNHY